MMRIDTARPDQVRFVAEWMRERDYAEISALHFTDDRAELVEVLTNVYGRTPETICATWRGTPVAVGGFYQSRPRVASMGMFATDMFPRVGLGLTRFLVKQMMPRLVEAGIHRFECHSLADHDEVHEWLRVLGLSQEGPEMANFGKNGESFVTFSLVVDHARTAGH
jgi:hypothetical protein